MAKGCLCWLMLALAMAAASQQVSPDLESLRKAAETGNAQILSEVVMLNDLWADYPRCLAVYMDVPGQMSGRISLSLTTPDPGINACLHQRVRWRAVVVGADPMPVDLAVAVGYDDFQLRSNFTIGAAYDTQPLSVDLGPGPRTPANVSQQEQAQLAHSVAQCFDQASKGLLAGGSQDLAKCLHSIPAQNTPPAGPRSAPAPTKGRTRAGFATAREKLGLAPYLRDPIPVTGKHPYHFKKPIITRVTEDGHHAYVMPEGMCDGPFSESSHSFPHQGLMQPVRQLESCYSAQLIVYISYPGGCQQYSQEMGLGDALPFAVTATVSATYEPFESCTKHTSAMVSTAAMAVGLSISGLTSICLLLLFAPLAWNVLALAAQRLKRWFRNKFRPDAPGWKGFIRKLVGLAWSTSYRKRRRTRKHVRALYRDRLQWSTSWLSVQRRNASQKAGLANVHSHGALRTTVSFACVGIFAALVAWPPAMRLILNKSARPDIPLPPHTEGPAGIVARFFVAAAVSLGMGLLYYMASIVRRPHPWPNCKKCTCPVPGVSATPPKPPCWMCKLKSAMPVTCMVVMHLLLILQLASYFAALPEMEDPRSYTWLISAQVPCASLLFVLHVADLVLVWHEKQGRGSRPVQPLLARLAGWMLDAHGLWEQLCNATALWITTFMEEPCSLPAQQPACPLTCSIPVFDVAGTAATHQKHQGEGQLVVITRSRRYLDRITRFVTWVQKHASTWIKGCLRRLLVHFSPEFSRLPNGRIVCTFKYPSWFVASVFTALILQVFWLLKSIHFGHELSACMISLSTCKLEAVRNFATTYSMQQAGVVRSAALRASRFLDQFPPAILDDMLAGANIPVSVQDLQNLQAAIVEWTTAGNSPAAELLREFGLGMDAHVTAGFLIAYLLSVPTLLLAVICCKRVFKEHEKMKASRRHWMDSHCAAVAHGQQQYTTTRFLNGHATWHETHSLHSHSHRSRHSNMAPSQQVSGPGQMMHPATGSGDAHVSIHIPPLSGACHSQPQHLPYRNSKPSPAGRQEHARRASQRHHAGRRQRLRIEEPHSAYYAAAYAALDADITWVSQLPGFLVSATVLQQYTLGLLLDISLTIINSTAAKKTIHVLAAYGAMFCLAFVLYQVLGIMVVGGYVSSNGQIKRPAGWEAYLVIMSIASLPMGTLFALFRLVWLLATSLITVGWLHRPILIVGKKLDLAYRAFKALVRLGQDPNQLVDAKVIYPATKQQLRVLQLQSAITIAGKLGRKGFKQLGDTNKGKARQTRQHQVAGLLTACYTGQTQVTDLSNATNSTVMEAAPEVGDAEGEVNAYRTDISQQGNQPHAHMSELQVVRVDP